MCLLIALKILADYNAMIQKPNLVKTNIQQALSLCKDFNNLRPIVITEHSREDELSNIDNQPFLTEIFYFLSQLYDSVKIHCPR